MQRFISGCLPLAEPAVGPTNISQNLFSKFQEACSL